MVCKINPVQEYRFGILLQNLPGNKYILHKAGGELSNRRSVPCEKTGGFCVGTGLPDGPEMFFPSTGKIVYSGGYCARYGIRPYRSGYECNISVGAD